VMTGAARLRNMERPKILNQLLLDYQENVE
jgi:hypothetical protein